LALAESQPTQNPQKKRYRQTEELKLTHRLKGFPSQYGFDHPATIDTTSRPATIFKHQNRFHSAETLRKQVADYLQKTVSENGPRTLVLLANSHICSFSKFDIWQQKDYRNMCISKASMFLHQLDVRLCEK
jgi:hypothetical protein